MAPKPVEARMLGKAKGGRLGLPERLVGNQVLHRSHIPTQNSSAIWEGLTKPTVFMSAENLNDQVGAETTELINRMGIGFSELGGVAEPLWHPELVATVEALWHKCGVAAAAKLVPV